MEFKGFKRMLNADELNSKADNDLDSDDLAFYTEKLSKIDTERLSVFEQLTIMFALTTFVQTIKPIIDKYLD